MENEAVIEHKVYSSSKYLIKEGFYSISELEELLIYFKTCGLKKDKALGFSMRERVMSENLMNGEHKATNEAYRDGYDNIYWGNRGGSVGLTVQSNLGVLWPDIKRAWFKVHGESDLDCLADAQKDKEKSNEAKGIIKDNV